MALLSIMALLQFITKQLNIFCFVYLCIYLQADVILTTGNRPTLSQWGKEGVVLYRLHSRYLYDGDSQIL